MGVRNPVQHSDAVGTMRARIRRLKLRFGALVPQAGFEPATSRLPWQASESGALSTELPGCSCESRGNPSAFAYLTTFFVLRGNKCDNPLQTIYRG